MRQKRGGLRKFGDNIHCMRKFIIPYLLLLFVFHSTFSQSIAPPKTLAKAIVLLEKNCPDSVKKKLINVDDNQVSRLRPDYPIIADWADDTGSNLYAYFNNKDLAGQMDDILFVGLKHRLLGQRFDENKLLTPFIEKQNREIAEHKVKLTADTIQGIYIPRDLEDCFKQIDGFWSDSSKDAIRQWTIDEFTAKSHFGFGMWMRNNWQLWGGSRLSSYFNNMGVYHPDDMSGIILDNYYHHLKQEPTNLDSLIAHYKKYWEEAKVKDSVSKKAQFDAYAIGDTITFKYHYGYANKKQEADRDDDVCSAQGIVVERDEKYFRIKVLLTKACGKYIVSYDSKDVKVVNARTGYLEAPKKREVKHLKVGERDWFYFDDWEKEE